MEIKEYDTALLRDGRSGSVCEVWGDGEAFEVDFPRPMEGSPWLRRSTQKPSTGMRSSVLDAWTKLEYA